MSFQILTLALFLLISSTLSQYISQNGPPRFIQNSRKHQYTYLGDTIKLKCTAVGRPHPKVHWYFNGTYLNFTFFHEHPRFQDKGMELEIRRVEVEDKGNWACKVWNNEGSITRNFTLHIIDFCDYFLSADTEAVPVKTSEACLCEWLSTKEPTFDGEFDSFYDAYCLEYAKDIEVTKFRSTAHLMANCEGGKCPEKKLIHYDSAESDTFAVNTPLDPVRFFDELKRLGVPDVQTMFPGLIDDAEMLRLRSALNSYDPNLDTEEKVERARSILRERIPELVHEHEAEKKKAEKKEIEYLKKEAHQDGKSSEVVYDEEEEDEEGGFISTVTALPLHGTTPAHPFAEIGARAFITSQRRDEKTNDVVVIDVKEDPLPTTTTRSYTNIWTTRKWRIPVVPTKVAPYFKQPEEENTIVLPSGRTLKLSCKAGGIPEPQVIWRKDHEEVGSESERRSGAAYKVRKWSLELEDASEADSGHYSCDVFNTAGTIRRDFRVEVRDRIRSRPIILPNVLLNQTVNANGTVNFTCQVLSDLIPHVVWIKLIKLDGSYIRWDEKQSRHVFNFLDMSKVKKARIFHDNLNKRYTLVIFNTSIADQGIYSCVAGNTLGMSMANATLTVNEFRAMTLPTDNPYPAWPLAYTVLLILFILMLLLCAGLAALYYFFSDRVQKNRIQNLDKMAVRKKVIITKKPQKEDVWSDLASSYAITVEPVINGDRTRRQHSEESGVSEYEVPTDMAWEIERNRLTLKDIVGEGAFGEVWKGTMAPKPKSDEVETKVAVKKLKPAAQEKELIILVSEMQIFKSIGQHKNILKLVGCCTGTGPLLVVLEYCPHGNLRDFLRKHRPKTLSINTENSENPESSNYQYTSTHKASTVEKQSSLDCLTLKDLIRFSTEIAHGMEFLASRKIIHRDLAARNILVAEDYSMKISDFGLSRNIFYQDYYRKKGAGRLPIKWMAPEALEANVYTVYSDVWSYGIVLWEIMTLGGTPYPSIAMPQLYNVLKDGYRMEPPHNCPEEIYGVMVMCWQEKPEARPQFQTIADYFEWLVAEAMKMNQGSIDEHYMTTEELKQGENGKRKRPLSAPGMLSIETFVKEYVKYNPKHGSVPNLHDDPDTKITFSTVKSNSRERGRSHQTKADEKEPLLDSAFQERKSYENIHEYMNNQEEVSEAPIRKFSEARRARFPPLRQPRISESSGEFNQNNIQAGTSRLNEPIVHVPTTLTNHVVRSPSVESSSSGHGGSSAMSSAEGFGINEISQIVYTTIEDAEKESLTPK
ncbi:unnamed protein product [Bursaphelenchus xylophilus]|nr:unnamed protein product [Bursaphelenchus xylophilus]CAG9111281.1 unnamed protein product [Bursaphelenchus xylophilus]